MSTPFVTEYLRTQRACLIALRREERITKSELEVLAVVQTHGTATNDEIVKALPMNKQQLRDAIEALTKAGNLIHTRKWSRGRMRHYYHISMEGEMILERFERLFWEMNEAIFSQFSANSL